MVKRNLQWRARHTICTSQIEFLCGERSCTHDRMSHATKAITTRVFEISRCIVTLCNGTRHPDLEHKISCIGAPTTKTRLRSPHGHAATLQGRPTQGCSQKACQEVANDSLAPFLQQNIIWSQGRPHIVCLILIMTPKFGLIVTVWLGSQYFIPSRDVKFSDVHICQGLRLQLHIFEHSMAANESQTSAFKYLD